MPRTKVGVGIGAVVVDPFSGRVLLGRRKGSHGAGLWALPGGWLEEYESFERCALREVHEETGLKADDVAPPADGGGSVMSTVSNNIMVEEGVHSVTIFVLLRLVDRDAADRVRVCEPDKCHEWRWLDPATIDRLHEDGAQAADVTIAAAPLFPPLARLVKSSCWPRILRNARRAPSENKGAIGRAFLFALPLIPLAMSIALFMHDWANHRLPPRPRADDPWNYSTWSGFMYGLIAGRGAR